jgi:hypothetical protein
VFPLWQVFPYTVGIDGMYNPIARQISPFLDEGGASSPFFPARRACPRNAQGITINDSEGNRHTIIVYTILCQIPRHLKKQSS